MYCLRTKRVFALFLAVIDSKINPILSESVKIASHMCIRQHVPSIASNYLDPLPHDRPAWWGRGKEDSGNGSPPHSLPIRWTLSATRLPFLLFHLRRRIITFTTLFRNNTILERKKKLGSKLLLLTEYIHHRAPSY